jgi:hypothetical protein
MLEFFVMTGYVLFVAFLFIGMPGLLIAGLYLLLARIFRWRPFMAGNRSEVQ